MTGAGFGAEEQATRRARKVARLRDEAARGDAVAAQSLRIAQRDQRNWSAGAEGERQVADALLVMERFGWVTLHDVHWPGRPLANIDHIAVAPSGVYVIDAKRYKGRPDLRIQGGILRPRTTTLVVGGRDCTKLLDGLHKQVDLVRSALEQSHPDVGVRGMLCFVDADWPLIGGAFSIDQVVVLWPKKAAQVLNKDGQLTGDQVSVVHQFLATTFPVA